MDHTSILRSTRITEKASLHQGLSIYTFDVAPAATKRDIMRAVHSLYKVKPTKVAIVQVPSKKTRNVRTGKTGIKKGGKKAYVYLKKGDSISLS